MWLECVISVNCLYNYHERTNKSACHSGHLIVELLYTLSELLLFFLSCKGHCNVFTIEWCNHILFFMTEKLRIDVVQVKIIGYVESCVYIERMVPDLENIHTNHWCSKIKIHKGLFDNFLKLNLKYQVYTPKNKHILQNMHSTILNQLCGCSWPGALAPDF